MKVKPKFNIFLFKTVFHKQLFVLIFLMCHFINISCDENLIVIKQYVDSNDINERYVCITNTSTALSFVKNYEEVLEEEPSIFIKKFFTKFKSQLNWEVENSLTGHVNEIILDWRWEGLKLFTTAETLEENNTLNYVYVTSIQENKFIIPISIRIQSDAHMFLCDAVNISSANCYWFIMDAGNRANVSVKKCLAGNQSVSINDQIKRFCEPIMHFRELNKIDINKKKWSNFKLSKKGNIFKLSNINDNFIESTIIEFEDRTPFDVRHLYVHSENKIGYFKIHEIEYFFTTEIIEQEIIGKLSYIHYYQFDHPFCVSMFVSMCSTCKLQLRLISKKFPHRIILEQYYKLFSRNWTEIKFIGENVKENEVLLAISTSNNNGEGFWALDQIRTCRKKEFRMITTMSRGNIECELVGYAKNSLSVKEDTFNKVNFCPEYTFSSFCVPCGLVFFPSCDRLKICETSNSRLSCFCSSGYLNSTNDCSVSCPLGFYGHGCKKECKTCKNLNCSNIDGSCRSSCIEGYEGTNCNIEVTKAGISTVLIISVILTIIVILVAIIVAYWKRKILLRKLILLRNNSKQKGNLETLDLNLRTEAAETVSLTNTFVTAPDNIDALEERDTVNAEYEQFRIPGLIVASIPLNVDNTPGADGQTPLHVAALNGDFDATRMLINCGADVNVRNDKRETPLHLACWKGHINVVKFLVYRGANVNVTDTSNWTPLTLACKEGHLDVVEYLIEKGAIINIVTDGWHPLSVACFYGFTEIVNKLIENGADVDEVSAPDGNTPLHRAACNGYLEIVKILIGKNVDVNATDKTGYTPLHLASQNGHIKIVELLIKKGARKDVKNNNGRTPLMLASVRGHKKIVNKLMKP